MRWYCSFGPFSSLGKSLMMSNFGFRILRLDFQNKIKIETSSYKNNYEIHDQSERLFIKSLSDSEVTRWVYDVTRYK